MRPAANRDRSSKRPAGRMRGVSPTGADQEGADRHRSHQTHRRAVAIEREINGLSPSSAYRACRERSTVTGRPRDWLRAERRRLSSKSDTAKAIEYSSSAGRHSLVLGDGRLCIYNNAASGRCAASLSGVTTGASQDQRRWQGAAAIYTSSKPPSSTTSTAGWLADVLARLPIISQADRRTAAWNWRSQNRVAEAA